MTVGFLPRMVTAEKLRLAYATHAACKGLDVGEHAGGEAGLGLAIGIEPGLHAIDDGRTDDGGIGVARDRRRLLRRLDAETDADRQLGVALDARNMRGDRFLRRRLGAGDAEHRDEVD